ncbi:MAG: DoxX family protein [Pseudomonadota bacterium]|nr:DoxX family protein [Pseudomonadota bacterium]
MRSHSSRQSPGVVTARVLLASVFVVMGALRLLGAYQGLPTAGSTLVLSTLELLLGIMIAGGWKVRWTAFAAMVLLLADALLSHKFWSLTGIARDAQLLHFMKNISMAGGFLLLSLVSGHKSRY